MSEHKISKEQLDEIHRAAVDTAKPIEIGWVGYRVAVIPPNASDIQLSESRKAFFAGAQHLWGTVMSMLEPGSDETPNDMRRMDYIAKELEAFYQQMKSEVSDA